MQKIRLYPLKILFAVLLVFSLLGTQLLFFTRQSVLHQKTFTHIIQNQQLTDKTYQALETYFESRSNSTGIPAAVFLNALDQEALQQGMLSSVSDAFSYLNGQTDTYQFQMDFTGLEQDITAFFENYAAENACEKNDAYYQKIDSTIQEAETKIIFIADIFKFSTLYENGWLTKAQHYMQLLSRFCLLAAVALAVILLLLIAFCAKQLHESLYWTGIAGLTAGLLLTVPCLYIQAGDYISGFIIKDEQIFMAIVGYLNTLLQQAITMGIITCLVSVVLLILFGVTHARHRSPD